MTKWEAFDLQNRASGITKQGKYYRMAQFSQIDRYIDRQIDRQIEIDRQKFCVKLFYLSYIQ